MSAHHDLIETCWLYFKWKFEKRVSLISNPDNLFNILVIGILKSRKSLELVFVVIVYDFIKI